MTDDALISQWDEQMETARAALEQAFKIADAMADRIDAYAERERIATDARRKSEARAEQLAATNERLEAALRKIAGECGCSIALAALKGAYHE